MSARRRTTRAIPAKVAAPDAMTMLRAAIARELEQLSSAAAKRMTPTQRSNYLKRCLEMQAKVRALGGEDLSEEELVQLPAFQRVVVEIVAALEKWPDAMVAVADALERNEGEKRRTGT